VPPDLRWWLCPAGELPITCLGYARGASFGQLGLRLERELAGIAREYSGRSRRGEPRLTSGGKAVTYVEGDLGGKAKKFSASQTMIPYFDLSTARLFLLADS
jgi:hypothetical protein